MCKKIHILPVLELLVKEKLMGWDGIESKVHYAFDRYFQNAFGLM